MPARFVVFDVETPNRRNDRMSSIGVAVVEDGAVRETFSSLVNPETWFDRFNVELTGITPAAAEEAPTFGELWPVMAGYLEGGLLVAHNAPFDMGVLAKCLRAYCVDWYDEAEYACTVRMGRRCLPALPDHRLSTLCAYFGIGLDAHRADSDSLACAELLLRYMDRGVDVRDFMRTYDLVGMRTLPGTDKRRSKAW
ncbi:MAG: 3'-5' exonuclease [Oscillospiraceae bacterium]|nr:3'-5' exonuclease [Oscillospiraceae bacterium]